MKRPNKYTYLYVIQGYYYGTWEDETQTESLKEARQHLRAYRQNMPQYAHRIIQRRELNPA